MQNIRTGHTQRDDLVTEMDPDAVNRGDGAVLAADDAVSSLYFHKFVNSLFPYKELRKKLAASFVRIHSRRPT